MLQRQSTGPSIRTPRRVGTLVALLAFLAALIGLTGCSKDDSASGSPSPSKSAAAEGADRVEPLASVHRAQLPVTVRSADGHDVTVRATDRIVPLTGALAETVFTLGLGEHVVARDVTATFEQARKLPVVTRGHDVSAESVLSLKPTLVLAETSTGPAEAVGRIRDAGIPVVVLDPAKKLADIGPRIDKVAEALGVRSAGDELRRRTEQRLDAARKGVPHDGKKPRVAFLYLRGSASVYLLGGPGSGADSLVEAAGGVDAGEESGLKRDFTPVTSEALAKAAPDVLLVMRKGLESVGGVDGLLKIPGVAQTPAGMDRRVASSDDGALLNFGPRTDTVLTSLIEQIHPKRS
ncbi:hemin ABC transporter substrate-binding protein [Streptomyces sp. NPDC020799]|uniref:hemin ABC transporter substrate-binding protein n=1 Tax=Streptomyces sp. NPDC020799 TaxID=3365091 RepID=UPI0037BE18FA